MRVAVLRGDAVAEVGHDRDDYAHRQRHTDYQFDDMGRTHAVLPFARVLRTRQDYPVRLGFMNRNMSVLPCAAGTKPTGRH